jgi:hypothetical protein
MLKSYGIYGGDRNLNPLSTYKTLSENLEKSNDFLPEIQQDQSSSNTGQTTNLKTIFKILNNDPTKSDFMIYALKLYYSFTSLSSQNVLTDSSFNIKISYENSLYYQNIFTINTIYKVRNDNNILDYDKNNTFIFTLIKKF